MHSASKWALLDVIRRCDNFPNLKQIHAQAITTGLVFNDLVANSFVEYFGKYASVFYYACDFLKQLDWRLSSFPFNTLISGYSISNVPRTGFLVYRRIVRDGFVPDTYTFPAVFKSCAKSLGAGEGSQVHGVVVKMGFSSHVYVQNSLVNWYCVCSDCVGASKVFDEMLVRDVVTWTCLISGFVRESRFDEALGLFLRMDVEPSFATFVSVLGACGRKGDLNLGRAIHGSILKRHEDTGLVLGNVLVDMYVKCEHLTEAKQMFHELSERDVVSWNCLISGSVQCERPKEALDLFREMQSLGIEPDEMILTSVLSSCASIGALDYGKWVHEYIERKGIKRDIHIRTTMIDMYAKCGCINTALRIFNETPSPNTVTWNALLNGMAMNGLGHEAIGQFEEMKKSSSRPNAVTFLAVLTACCHSGLVEEGQRYFREMKREPYNISPRLEHYGCVVDLLCRAGLLCEAQNLITKMPMKPDVSIWGALLSACNAAGNVKISQEILNRLLEVESRDSGAYVLLSNIYATSKKWADVTRVRRLMKQRGVRKAPGSSVIEVNGKACEFVVGDSSHPQNDQIHTLLGLLAKQARIEACFHDHFL